MSSATGNPGGGGGVGGGATTTPASTVYHCYQCERRVSITPSLSSSLTSDPVCPSCNGGFLEEIENPNPNNSNPFFGFSSDDNSGLSGIPLMFSSSSTVGGGGGGGGGSMMDPFGGGLDLNTLLQSIAGGGLGVGIRRSGGGGSGGGDRNAEVFSPIDFFHNYIQSLRDGGANIQFVIDDNNMDLGGGGEGLFSGGGGGIGGRGGGGFGIPATFGDYIIGGGLEQLIQQLAENDPNRYGTPPASKSAVEGLPSINITKELMESDSSQCAVCKDEFELGMDARQMPCRHIYHPDCIVPWLELHNSCPVCRYELPTDDPDYENRTTEGNQGGNRGSGNPSEFTVNLGESGGSGGATQDNSPSPRTAERRFSISFPWPFGRAEGSNSNSGNNNNNSDSNSGNRGDPNSGSGPTAPNLD